MSVEVSVAKRWTFRMLSYPELGMPSYPELDMLMISVF